MSRGLRAACSVLLLAFGVAAGGCNFGHNFEVVRDAELFVLALVFTTTAVLAWWRTGRDPGVVDGPRAARA